RDDPARLHLPARAGLGRPEPPGHGRGAGPGPRRAGVHRERVVEPPARGRRGGRPVGGGAAGVGHRLAAAGPHLPPRPDGPRPPRRRGPDGPPVEGAGDTGGRPALDVSHLPPAALDARAPGWWGNALLTAIETTTVALLVASYLYLWRNFPQSLWPPPRVDRD